jgi:AcrR family transcriptional regulator
LDPRVRTESIPKVRAAPRIRAGDRIFKVAADLFYNEGIRAVGVETIVKKAGVAKISLYRKFASKDDLIVSYLENRNADYWRVVDEIIGRREGCPREQLRSLMAYVADRTTAQKYRGCPFINYAGEFRESSHPGHRVVAANKREMWRRLLRLATGIDAHQPIELADALFLLIEGAYASSQTLGGRTGPARHLVSAAENIIESHLRG